MLLDLGERYTLDLNPEWPSNLIFENETIRIEFDTNESKRTLKVNGTNNKYEHVEIDVEIENDLNNEKMVIATPFEKKTQFYLNYKENYYRVNAKVKFDDFELTLERGFRCGKEWKMRLWCQGTDQR